MKEHSISKRSSSADGNDAKKRRTDNDAASSEEVESPVPAEFICPITQHIMKDPVIIEEGHTFEREAIVRHIQSQESPRNPLTNEVLSNLVVVPNRALKNVITHFLEQNPAHRKSVYQSAVISKIEQAIVNWEITDLESFIDKLVSVEDADDKARINHFKFNNGKGEHAYNEAFGFLRLVLHHKPTLLQLTKVLSWIDKEDLQNAITAVNHNGWNAVHLACRYGNDVMVNALLMVNAAKAIIAVNNEGWNALHIACKYGIDAMVNALLSKLNENDAAKAIIATSNKGWNALHLACQVGNDVMVRAILNKLDENNAVKAILAASDKGWNALHFACRDGNNVIANALLNKLDENDAAKAIIAINNEGWNALHLACEYGNDVMVNALLNRLNENDAAKAITAANHVGWNALLLACRYGNDVMVNALLNKLDENNTAKAITAVNHDGWNALHFACRYGNNVMVNALLNKLDKNNAAKAITAVNRYGWNALHFACLFGDANRVNALLRRAGNQAASLFAARINKYGDQPANMHPIELVMKNEPAENREQILRCLRETFPNFFEEYGFQELQRQTSNTQESLSTLIKKTEEQLAKKARKDSVTIRLPAALFTRKKAVEPESEAEPKASESDRSVIRRARTARSRIA